MKPYYSPLFVFFFIIFLYLNIYPQNTLSLSELAQNINPKIEDASIEAELNTIYREILNNPETLNLVLKESFEKLNANNFLKDLDIKFKTFQYDSISALGITYSYFKNIKSNYFTSSSANSSGINFSINTEGNIAFIRRDNPNDFLKSGLAVSYFNSSGGVIEFTDQLSDSLTAVQKLLSSYNNIDSLNESDIWKKYLAKVSANLTNQLYFNFSLNLNLESNQDFSIKNYVYGINVGFDVKAWNRNSALAQLNILDWPFAVTRWLTGTDNNISPLGSSLPTLLFNVSYIDPSADSLRRSLNELKKYSRLGFEAGFKTLFSRSLGAPLYVNADLRYYKEINASSLIKTLGLDESIYFIILLSQENGFFISYASGKLPQDIQNNNVYAVGFNYKF
ncbi:MAG TPA: hypothetical protein VMT35_06060 [Ignavibacteriaceae bacterium]|nr:hypothetical protein [Ignavibacteriaceae bacterium]